MGCTVHDTSCKKELFPFDSTEIEQQQNKSDIFAHIRMTEQQVLIATGV